MGWEIAWEPGCTSQMGAALRNYRCICPANESSYSGSKIRITVTAHGAGAATLDGTSIGLMTTVDDMDNPANGTFKRITWTTAGGGNGITCAAGVSKVSDEITFAFDKTKRYGIHIYMLNRENWMNTDVGDGMYWDAGAADDTLTQTVSYTDLPGYTGVITKLEVFVATGSQTISGVGNIASGEGFGTLGANFRLFPGTISSEEAFGILKANLKLLVDGIVSGEAFGTPSVSNWLQYLLPLAITSKEAFGTLSIGTIRRVVEEIFFDANIRRSESFIAFRNKLEEAIAHIKRIVDEE